MVQRSADERADSRRAHKTSIDIYWNGEHACATETRPVPTTNRGQCFLGSGEEWFKGQMSHIMMWDCRLTKEELKTVYTTQKGLPKVDKAPLMALSIEPEDRAEVFTQKYESKIPVTGDFKKDLEHMATRFDIAVETKEWLVTLMGDKDKIDKAGDDLKAMFKFYEQKKRELDEKCEEMNKRQKRESPRRDTRGGAHDRGRDNRGHDNRYNENRGYDNRRSDDNRGYDNRSGDNRPSNISLQPNSQWMNQANQWMHGAAAGNDMMMQAQLQQPLQQASGCTARQLGMI